MGLDARLRLARLYLCTDARAQRGDLAEFLDAVLAGGVDVVQIRQHGMSPKAELGALEVARRAAAQHQAIVCVHGSPQLAADFQADMLHLGHHDAPTSEARPLLHPWALLGRSASAEAQVVAGLADPDLDYLWVGPLRSGADPAAPDPGGLDLVRYASRAAPVYALAAKPWFAVGGITAGNVEAVLEAGARRVAVGRAVTAATDPHAAAAELARTLHAAWQADPASQRYSFAAAGSTGRTR